MSTQDKLEKILRQIHVLVSKGETFEQSKDKVIISKKEMFSLLSDLNLCVLGMMDEYELTQQSRDKAEREAKKKGDKIVQDAGLKAEDVYAASVLYTNEALNHIQTIMQNATESMDEVFKKLQGELKERKDTVRENQLELEGQLHDLADTKKYLQMIENRNREIEKSRMKERSLRYESGEEASQVVATGKPEIKINEEYFKQAGIPMETEEVEEPKEHNVVEIPEIKVNLDAEYFKWREEKKEEK